MAKLTTSSIMVNLNDRANGLVAILDMDMRTVPYYFTVSTVSHTVE